MSDSLVWLLPVALAGAFGWCLVRGIITGQMRTIYVGVPAAAKDENRTAFFLLAGFNLACMLGSIWIAFDLAQ